MIRQKLAFVVLGPPSLSLRRMNGFSPVRIRRLGSAVLIGIPFLNIMKSQHNIWTAERARRATRSPMWSAEVLNPGAVASVGWPTCGYPRRSYQLLGLVGNAASVNSHYDGGLISR